MGRGGQATETPAERGAARAAYRCFQRGAGTMIVTFTDRLYTLEGDEQAIVIEDPDGVPAGFLLFEVIEDSKRSPRPSVGRPHLYLHSAWVPPDRRGKGLFTKMSRSLLRRYPSYPVIGMPTHDAVSRFFNRVERMPGRSSDPDFHPYRGMNGRDLE